MSELALPDPQRLAAGQVPALVERITAARRELRAREDVVGAEELRRRLAAYERYVADKKAKRALEAESRRTEILVGELLGEPPGSGGDRRSAEFQTESFRLKIDHKYHEFFWRQSQYPNIVEAEIAADRTKRAKILDAITRHELAAKTPPGESAVRLGDWREALADLPDESVDLIFTDPPYARGHVDDYGDIAAFGARVLKPGGSLLAYCGQYALPAIFDQMGDHLRYWWLCACVHEGGQHRSLSGVRAYVLWKPIVWYVKGTNGAVDFVYDAIIRPAPDKAAHDWQQALEEPRHYIAHLCPADGLVVDPYAGGGTTEIAAKELGRRFIGAERDSQHRAVAAGRTAQ